MAFQKTLHHNFYHYLFVSGVGLVQDVSATLIGLVLLFLASLLWQGSTESFLQMAVALPLFILGISIVLINITGIFSLLFNKQLSISRCPFCNNQS